MKKKTPAETPGTTPPPFEWEPPVLYPLTELPKDFVIPGKPAGNVQQG